MSMRFLLALLVCLSAPALAQDKLPSLPAAGGSGTSGGGNPMVPVVQKWADAQFKELRLLPDEDRERALRSVDQTPAYCKDASELNRISKALGKADHRNVYRNVFVQGFVINPDATEIYANCEQFEVWDEDFQKGTGRPPSVILSALYFYLRTSGMSESSANDVVTRTIQNYTQTDFNSGVKAYHSFIAGFVAKFKAFDPSILPEGFDLGAFQEAAEKLAITAGPETYPYVFPCSWNEGFDGLYRCAETATDRGRLGYNHGKSTLIISPGVDEQDFKASESVVYWILRSSGMKEEPAYSIAARLRALDKGDQSKVDYMETVDISTPDFDALKATVFKDTTERLVASAADLFAQDPAKMPGWNREMIDRLEEAVKAQKVVIVHREEELSGCESGVVACSTDPRSGIAERVTRVLIDKVQVEGVPALAYHEAAVLAGVERDGHYKLSDEMKDAVWPEKSGWTRWFEEFYGGYLRAAALCMKGRTFTRLAQLAQMDPDFAALARSGALLAKSDLMYEQQNFTQLTCHPEVQLSPQGTHSQFMFWSVYSGSRDSWVTTRHVGELLIPPGWFVTTVSDSRYQSTLKKLDAEGFAQGLGVLAPGVAMGNVGNVKDAYAVCDEDACIDGAVGILKYPKATP